MLRPGRDMPWKEFFLGLKREWERDHCDLAAGAIAFFAMLSLFPFLLFLVALAGVIIDPADTKRLVDELSTVAPPEVTKILTDQLLSVEKTAAASLLGFGALAALWSASGGMMTLTGALNSVYEAKETRPFWKVRGMAIAMVVVSAVLLLAATLAAVAVEPIVAAFDPRIAYIVSWVRFPVAIIVVGLVLAMLYSVLPNAPVKFRLITPGSVVGVALWALASYGFSLYVKHFGNYAATYGALGGVIVLLLWLWISANAVLVGAEVNTVLDENYEKGRAWRKATECEPAPRHVPAFKPMSKPRLVGGLALLLRRARRA